MRLDLDVDNDSQKGEHVEMTDANLRGLLQHLRGKM